MKIEYAMCACCKHCTGNGCLVYMEDLDELVGEECDYFEEEIIGGNEYEK